MGNVMTVVLGGNHERGFHQLGGPKELPKRRQLRELMGMVVETRDWGYQGQVVALCGHCVRNACTCRETHPRSPATYLLAQQIRKAHKITTNTWGSTWGGDSAFWPTQAPTTPTPGGPQL